MKRGDTRYGICSTEFLDEAFRTESYLCDITFNDDGSWTYLVETELLVKGKRHPVQSSRHQHLEACWGAGTESVAVILKDRAEKKVGLASIAS